MHSCKNSFVPPALLTFCQVIRLLVYVRVAYDCLLLVDQLEVPGDRLEALLVRI